MARAQTRVIDFSKDPKQLLKFLDNLVKNQKGITKIANVRALSACIRNDPSMRSRGSSVATACRLSGEASADMNKAARDTSALPDFKLQDPKDFGDGMKEFSHLKGSRLTVSTTIGGTTQAANRLRIDLIKSLGETPSQKSIFQLFLDDQLKKAGK